MPSRIKQDEDSKNRSSEEVDDQTDQVLRLGLSILGHPEDECEHVQVRNKHTSEEAYGNIPRHS